MDQQTNEPNLVMCAAMLADTSTYFLLYLLYFVISSFRHIFPPVSDVALSGSGQLYAGTLAGRWPRIHSDCKDPFPPVRAERVCILCDPVRLESAGAGYK